MALFFRRALTQRLDDLQRQLTALQASVVEAALKAAQPPALVDSPLYAQLDRLVSRLIERGDQPPAAPIDKDVLIRMLQSIEELSGKFYQVWEKERQAAREQRKGARAVGVAKMRAAQAVEDQLPLPVMGCAACLDIIDGSEVADAVAKLVHMREEHDLRFARWLRPKVSDAGIADQSRN